ncbi:hypothetical protein [Rhodococcoides fascians]|uniref:hypothetical protein n=1 Tax=Rhodococcoides fascians TaxID=1828 RepID=UPI00278B4F8C|nr:hypothetical protein [Rhodococcus fascians]MDQ0284740.1 hypothetical protein [Rhodococcus fascians]
MSLPPYTPGPADWRYLDQVEAADLWNELVPWVEHLRARYDLGSRHILGCWFKHHPLVEELTAAMYAHREVYQLLKKNVYHGGLSAWHYQVLWPLIGRLDKVTSFDDCRNGECGYRPAPSPIADDVAEYIAADVEGRAEHIESDGPNTESPSDAQSTPSTLTMEEVIEMIDSGTAIAEDPADDFSAVEILGARWEYDDDADQYRQAE